MIQAVCIDAGGLFLLIRGIYMRRLLQMNFEQSEILETTPEYFSLWLEAEVKALRPPYAQPLEFREDGKTTYVTLQPPQRTNNKFEIQADAVEDFDDKEQDRRKSWYVVIVFHVKQLNNDEIQLIGGCKNYPRIKDYFDLLWDEILNVFPARPHPTEIAPHEQPGDNETKTEDEALPYWWPQRKSTKLKWKAEYKKIKPLYDKGKNFSQIQQATGIDRIRVSRIIQWANKDAFAHYD
jgi:hypothetical protein